MNKIDRLLLNLNHYAGQLDEYGQVLVHVASMKWPIPKIESLSRDIARSYVSLAETCVRLAETIRKALTAPAGRAIRRNPKYELDLAKIELLFLRLKVMVEAARHTVRRCPKSKKEEARAAAATLRMLEFQARQAARSAAIVAEMLEKRTPEWEEKLDISEWL